MRTKIVIAAILTTLLGAALPVAAQQTCKSTEDPERVKAIKEGPPSATLNFESTQVRLILGGGGGKGVLHYKGKDYPFKGKGASVGGIGASKAEGTGKVYFLDNLEDFAGTYGAITGGVALGKGVGASSWQNQKCVVLLLTSKSKGAGLFLGMAAIDVQLDKDKMDKMDKK